MLQGWEPVVTVHSTCWNTKLGGWSLCWLHPWHNNSKEAIVTWEHSWCSWWQYCDWWYSTSSLQGWDHNQSLTNWMQLKVVCLCSLHFACAILPRLCSIEWRAHSKLIGRAYISPFYWTVVVGSHPDKLEGTDKILPWQGVMSVFCVWCKLYAEELGSTILSSSTWDRTKRMPERKSPWAPSETHANVELREWEKLAIIACVRAVLCATPRA